MRAVGNCILMSRRPTSRTFCQQFEVRPEGTFFITSFVVCVTKWYSCSVLHDLWFLLGNLHKSVLDILKYFSTKNFHINRDMELCDTLWLIIGILFCFSFLFQNTLFFNNQLYLWSNCLNFLIYWPSKLIGTYFSSRI